MSWIFSFIKINFCTFAIIYNHIQQSKDEENIDNGGFSRMHNH